MSGYIWTKTRMNDLFCIILTAKLCPIKVIFVIRFHWLSIILLDRFYCIIDVVFRVGGGEEVGLVGRRDKVDVMGKEMFEEAGVEALVQGREGADFGDAEERCEKWADLRHGAGDFLAESFNKASGFFLKRFIKTGLFKKFDRRKSGAHRNGISWESPAMIDFP